ncbi:MAG: preprotein translocase subunit SecA, partial [Chloroflexota bacterium]|nr:preprotein translocase subunit SecA [Chloroflexota bacterium]
MGFFTRLLGDNPEKELKRIQPYVGRINTFEPDMQRLSDDDLRAKTGEYRRRFEAGESLDDLLPEAFATAREAARRTIGQRHYDVQLMGGVVLHQGMIAEMRTGEGKTLVATLPSYLNAIAGQGVHVVTVNDYLAKRDSEWMGPIHNFLGLSIGAVQHDMDFITRRAAYASDITYGTNNEFGFDYLRDNMVQRVEELVQQRGLHYGIVDEIDNILIDEARTPLIISGPAEESTDQYELFARVVPRLREGEDFEIDEKRRVISLTEEGIDRVEHAVAVKNLYDPDNYELTHYLDQSLKAQFIYKRDRDYVVKDGEVIIVDEFTGRLMPGRRYSEGLHQAIEAKEGVRVQRENVTLATITFQNYFRMYDKLGGMTGTASTELEEFRKIYNLEVVPIPTNRPMVRKDLADVIYKTEGSKFNAVVDEIVERHEARQPVLVGTVSIEKSEELSRLLERRGVAHDVLNAKQHEREAGIIAQAGRPGAVTIATNMAGRGVDILLGGNAAGLAEAQIRRKFKDAEEIDPEKAAAVEREMRELVERDRDLIIELGGLHIIGTERHESRRIDNQLRGRAGRQGDPGSSRFYISLEDDLMRRFGGGRISGLMDRLGLEEDIPLEHGWVSKAIENAQQKVESYNFDMRKHVVEYDDVMNKQRQTIYEDRRAILDEDTLRDRVFGWVEQEIEELVATHVDVRANEADLDALLDAYRLLVVNTQLTTEDLEPHSAADLAEFLLEDAERAYDEKE